MTRVERLAWQPLDLAEYAFRSRGMTELFRAVMAPPRNVPMAYILLLSIHGQQIGDASLGRRHAQIGDGGGS